MTSELEAVPIETVGPPLWEVGWARAVERDALWRYLGDPPYIETDSHCTFGGDEDWWTFRTRGGDDVFAVCLRVPYGDAVVCTSDPTEYNVCRAVELITPFNVEIFETPRLR